MRNAVCQAEIDRLSEWPRRVPTSTKLLGVEIEIADAASFLWTVPDVIERDMYAFPSTSAAPLIIDGGANIGLATIAFKRRYPASRIIVFEADPVIYGMLCRNLARWGYADVECHCKALWKSEGDMEFMVDQADAGRIASSQVDAPMVRVPTARLSQYLTEPVEMLKLDIEGAELEVLMESRDRLGLVRNVCVGYHSLKGYPQRLDTLFACLTEAGFRLYLEAEKLVPSPLLGRHEYLGVDAAFAIFGYRE